MKRDPRHEIDEELKFHLEQRILEYIAQGMSPEAARRAAMERLGNLAHVRNSALLFSVRSARRKIGESL